VGVHFAEGARLLSLAEMQGQVQSQHGPAALGKAFRGWLAAQLGDASGASSLACLGPAERQEQEQGPSGAARGGPRSGVQSSHGAERLALMPLAAACSAACGAGCSPTQAGSSRQAPPVLLPFTDTLRGGRQFCMDFEGRVWLRSGFNTVWMADSLTAFLRGVLQ
jgi:hypothetical protein